MFYVDSQRTTTRRDSSLIYSSRRYSQSQKDFDLELSTVRGQSTARLTTTESAVSLFQRTKGSVQREIVTLLFESMLDNIVDSWEVILPAREGSQSAIGKSASEVTSGKKKRIGSKGSKTKSAKSRSKLDLADGGPMDPMNIIWWAGADEKAIINFKNGNVYEGNVSMKCMNGEGRFQWADGTVYFGQFKENEMKGKGKIQWKDDTWYEGDFAGNIRHGNGLYVNSRDQRCYTGGWELATKHGDGVIVYSKDFKNSYDGEWVQNVRHGYGIREYNQISGYEGEWDYYVRDGKGLMIWSNHDFYRGEWKNGTMSGFGIYIWNAYFNHSMSFPSLQIYRGHWLKGQRNGFGFLQFGLGLGGHYKGEFKDNKKHGFGKLVTNNGLILRSKCLYMDDNLTSGLDDEVDTYTTRKNNELFEFDICDSTVGVRYHIEDALSNLDRTAEVRESTICKYVESNKDFDTDLAVIVCEEKQKLINDKINKELIEFETTALLKAIRCYETKLKEIYYTYATICNTEDIEFNPVLLRLYLWQLYYDCEINEKGLTFLEIDELSSKNRDWLTMSKHGPFEKIYFWQFMHSLISLTTRLYAQKMLPGPQPETILAKAFRYFMDNDVLPNAGRCKGYLTQNFGTYVPLKALYALYSMLGEPLSVRNFICAVRVPPHFYMDYPQPEMIDAPDERMLMGRNAYVIGDEMTFIMDDDMPYEDTGEYHDLPLINFGNLSTKTIVKIAEKIMPQVCHDKYVLDLEAKMTFFEFFHVFIACTEESYRVKDEELCWRDLFLKAEQQQQQQQRT